jgi:opacity protein-like surface antigen
MTRTGFCALAAACLALYGAASVAEPGFYAGVDLGLAEPSVKPSDGFQVYATGVPLSVLPESTQVRGTDAGWTAFVGYRMNRHLAAEFGYGGFGQVDIEETYDLSDFSPPLPPAAVLASSSEVSGPMLSMLGVFPFARDRVEAFVRAGVLFADQTLEGDLGIASGVELNNAEELWLVGAGLTLKTVRQWSARIEYQTVDELRANSMTGPIRLWRISLGVARHF